METLEWESDFEAWWSMCMDPEHGMVGKEQMRLAWKSAHNPNWSRAEARHAEDLRVLLAACRLIELDKETVFVIGTDAAEALRAVAARFPEK